MILKPTPQERAMKAHDVMLRAMAGELSWVQAADLMGQPASGGQDTVGQFTHAQCAVGGFGEQDEDPVFSEGEIGIALQLAVQGRR